MILTATEISYLVLNNASIHNVNISLQINQKANYIAIKQVMKCQMCILF